MSNARNLARLLPNASGQLPDANLAAIAASKLSGQLPLANIPSGSVLQVVTASTTTRTLMVGTSGFNVLNATITPKSSSSKIILLGSISAGYESGSPNYVAYFKRTISGQSTVNVGYFLDSNRWGGVSHSQIIGGDEQTETIPVNFYDTPNTTSQITYGIQVDVTDGSMYINRTKGYSDSDSNWNSRSTTTLMLIEVAA